MLREGVLFDMGKAMSSIPVSQAHESGKAFSGYGSQGNEIAALWSLCGY